MCFMHCTVLLPNQQLAACMCAETMLCSLLIVTSEWGLAPSLARSHATQCEMSVIAHRYVELTTKRLQSQGDCKRYPKLTCPPCSMSSRLSSHKVSGSQMKSSVTSHSQDTHKHTSLPDISNYILLDQAAEVNITKKFQLRQP